MDFKLMQLVLSRLFFFVTKNSVHYLWIRRDLVTNYVLYKTSSLVGNPMPLSTPSPQSHQSPILASFFKLQLHSSVKKVQGWGFVLASFPGPVCSSLAV